MLLMINLRSSFTALLKFYYFAIHTFDYHNFNYIRFFFLLYPIYFHSLTRALMQTSSEFNYTAVRSCHCVIPELDTHSAQNMLCTEKKIWLLYSSVDVIGTGTRLSHNWSISDKAINMEIIITLMPRSRKLMQSDY